ncbi:MAG: exosortase O [Caldilineales bacterium]
MLDWLNLNGLIGERGRTRVAWLQLGLNAAIAAVWLLLYRPVLHYLSRVATNDDFRTNQILLLGIAALLISEARRDTSVLRPRLDAAPTLHRWPLILALAASVAFLFAERFLAVNTLSATLFGLASYGLLGLWMSPPLWRSTWPAALLLIGVLPFGDHLQTFVGYPLRFLTARLVGLGLGALGVPSVGTDTILVFETGISQVDVPCSGIKSLWTGLLFLLAATVVQRRRVDARWLGTATLFVALLFAVNLARVAILVAVGEVLGLRTFAALLHVPLGVLGFGLACAVAAWGLRGAVEAAPVVAAPTSQPAARVALSLSVALIAFMVALVTVYAPRPASATAAASPVWRFPAELITQPLPLTAQERAWLAGDGAEDAQRWRFQWRGLSGSMILVTSSTWRGHHRPERCFEVYGLTLDQSSAHLVDADFALRAVQLGAGQGMPLSAAYWFQSATRITDDYGTRIWADLGRGRARWVLVSLLFDGPVDDADADAAALYRAIRVAVGSDG